MRQTKVKKLRKILIQRFEDKFTKKLFRRFKKVISNQHKPLWRYLKFVIRVNNEDYGSM